MVYNIGDSKASIERKGSISACNWVESEKAIEILIEVQASKVINDWNNPTMWRTWSTRGYKSTSQPSLRPKQYNSQENNG